MNVAENKDISAPIRAISLPYTGGIVASVISGRHFKQ
jgi:hypothetical protein